MSTPMPWISLSTVDSYENVLPDTTDVSVKIISWS